MSDGGKVSAAEVLKHSSAKDCWMVVNGKVYDLTSFAPNHPGGEHGMDYAENVHVSKLLN